MPLVWPLVWTLVSTVHERPTIALAGSTRAVHAPKAMQVEFAR